MPGPDTSNPQVPGFHFFIIPPFCIYYIQVFRLMDTNFTPLLQLVLIQITGILTNFTDLISDQAKR